MLPAHWTNGMLRHLWSNRINVHDFGLSSSLHRYCNWGYQFSQYMTQACTYYWLSTQNNHLKCSWFQMNQEKTFPHFLGMHDRHTARYRHTNGNISSLHAHVILLHLPTLNIRAIFWMLSDPQIVNSILASTWIKQVSNFLIVNLHKAK